jgi:fluoroacetyl-CoA thioesterase
MMNKIQVGLNSVIETIVQEKDSAINYGSGGVEVYATPAMIGLMECAAKNAVDLHLPAGYTTVGTRVDIKHLGATPIGGKVRACAELIEVNGRGLVFKVEAYDNTEKIGEGVHERFVIDLERFMNKLNNKTKLVLDGV